MNEEIKAISIDHFNLSNLIIVIIGRAVLTFSIFNDEKSLKRTVILGDYSIEAKSKTGSVQLQGIYTTPNRKMGFKFNFE